MQLRILLSTLLCNFVMSPSSRGATYCDERVCICLSVCMSLCLLTCIKNDMSTLHMLTVAVVQSFSDNCAIHYVLAAFLKDDIMFAHGEPYGAQCLGHVFKVGKVVISTISLFQMQEVF